MADLACYFGHAVWLIQVIECHISYTSISFLCSHAAIAIIVATPVVVVAVITVEVVDMQMMCVVR